MNKKERILRLLGEPGGLTDYVPAAFFIHFPPAYHRGQAAVDKHLEYFRHTDMDFVKIQYELPFPRRADINEPEDWVHMPRYGREFFQPQLDIVQGLVQAVQGEAMVIQTLYSPFMCAGHTAGSETLQAHLEQAPNLVQVGLTAITDSLLWFVRECARLGLDGFYASTQGGERGRFADPTLFARYIEPYDMAVMNEINRLFPFNTLHICDYHLPYDDLTPFLDYPGHVVNCPLNVGDRPLSARQAADLFGRPYMGGLDRHGIIAHGSVEEIRAAVADVLATAPAQFILAADCTLPGDTDWDHIRTAIDAAHHTTRSA